LDFSGLRLRLIKRRLLVLWLKIILILVVVGAGRLRDRGLPLAGRVATTHLDLLARVGNPNTSTSTSG